MTPELLITCHRHHAMMQSRACYTEGLELPCWKRVTVMLWYRANMMMMMMKRLVLGGFLCSTP